MHGDAISYMEFSMTIVGKARVWYKNLKLRTIGNFLEFVR